VGWGSAPHPKTPNPQSPIPNPQKNPQINKKKILFKKIT